MASDMSECAALVEQGLDEPSVVAAIEGLQPSAASSGSLLLCLAAAGKNDDTTADRSLCRFVTEDEAIASHRQERLPRR